MKQLVVILLAIGFSFTLRAQDNNTPFLTKSLADAAITSVQAETSGGNVTVNGVAAAEAKIEVYVQANNGRKNLLLSKEEIQKRMDEDYEFTLSTADHKLTVIAKPKDRSGRNWKRSLSISFKIFVPQNTSTYITTSGGNVSLAHLTGTQDFRTSGGNLHLDDLGGKIKGATSGGNIHLSDSKDDITLTTSGGNIEATNSKGKLNLTTSGGNVSLSALSGNIDAITSGGTVRGKAVSGELAATTSGGNVILEDMSCSLSASTSGGNISVGITALGDFVKLGNSGGNIDLQLPANKGIDLKLSGDKVKVDALTNFSGKVEDDNVEGKMNGGGVPITVRGNSGRVSLTFK